MSIDVNDLDLETLKALAAFALERLEEPSESLIEAEVRHPAPLELKGIARDMEDMHVRLSGDFEGDPQTEIDSRDIQSVVEAFEEQASPWVALAEAGVQQEREWFREEFSGALSLSVAHPHLQQAMSIHQWWIRAGELKLLEVCFRSMFLLSSREKAGEWLQESPSMSPHWRLLSNAWQYLSSPQAKQDWLPLLLETPADDEVYRSSTRDSIVTPGRDVRASFFKKAWQDAQTSALIVRTEADAGHYQSLANSILASGEVSVGLESLNWERLLYNHRQANKVATAQELEKGLSRLKNVPAEVLNGWLETPDDAPIDWAKSFSWNNYSGQDLSDYAIEGAVRHGKGSPRKLILPELERLSQSIAARVRSPELAEDYTRAFRGFELDRALPPPSSTIAKPRF